MVKNILFIFTFCMILSYPLLSQQQFNLKLKGHPESKQGSLHYKKSDLPFSLYALGIAAIISPMIVFEDKKVFFALTKEISIGKYPYGRISFEYSYVFRSYNTSQLRFSYNYDIALAGGDFIAFIASPGAGYFTDTKNKGWFIQGAIGALTGPGEYFLLNPYLRYRHTFINDKLKSDINDISLGMAFVLYF